MALLEIKNLHARVAAAGGKDILKGVESHHQHRRSPRDHGQERLAARARLPGAGGREAYEVTEGSITYDGKDLLELVAPKSARAKGSSWRFSIPSKSPASPPATSSRPR